MAKENQVNMPDGDSIQIPAWASEETMNRVVSYMSASNKTDQQFVTLMKGMGSNIQDFQKTLAGLVTAGSANSAAEKKEDKATTTFAGKTVQAAKSINKVAGFFGDAEKPLTSMTDGLSKLAKGSQSATDGILNFGGGLGKGSTAMAALAGAGDVAIDAVLAYAGWNAAKIQQFAVAQAKIIDSGAVFQGGAEAFDTLRKNTIDTGVTYTSLIDNITNFGEGMLGLGTTMSSGVQQFASFYKQLDQTAESLGDLGLSSKDMQTAYAEYIAYSRRTGMINKDLNRSAESVNNSFIQLQLEAGAVANLTALSRSEALARQMGASDNFGDAAQMTLRNAGLPGQADVVQAITHALGMAAPDSEHLQQILDAYQMEAFEKSRSGSMAAFDIQGRLQSINPGSVSAINNVLPGLIDNLTMMTRSGTEDKAGVQSAIYTAIRNYNDDQASTVGAARDSVAGQTQTLQSDMIKVTRILGNLADENEYVDQIEQNRTNLVHAGRTTLEMNNMTTRFLRLQETLTMDMETIALRFDQMQRVMTFAGDQYKSMMETLGFGGETNDFGGIDMPAIDVEHANNALHGTVDVNGNSVAASSQTTTQSNYDPDVVRAASIMPEAPTFDATDDMAKAQLLAVTGDYTVEDFENFSQIHNVTNAVAQLNSLEPEMRRRVAATMVDFEEAYAGTDTKLLLSEGFRSNARSDALAASGIQAASGGNSWHNYGLAMDFLGVQNGSIIENNTEGFYKGDNSVLEAIANANGLHNNQGPGDTGHYQLSETGQRVSQEAKAGNYVPDIFHNVTGDVDAGPIVPITVNQPDPAVTTPVSTTNVDEGTLITAEIQAELEKRGLDKGTIGNSLTPEDIAALQQPVVAADPVAVPANIQSAFDEVMASQNEIKQGNFLKELRERDDEGLAIAQQLVNHPSGKIPSMRRHGGRVNAGEPYIVGDQLGMQNAEMFVPDQPGNIVSNRDLQNNIKKAGNNRLTSNNNDSIIKSNEDLSGIIGGKEATIKTLQSLQSIVKRLNQEKSTKSRTAMTNSR